MNIGVYVTSNYSNYDRLSKMLTSYIRKYTTSPVLLTAVSPSTKPDHGNLLVKRYADEHHIRCKVYETEWGKWKRSAGSIASYHVNHNSERSFVFWDGLSRGCRNYLNMTKRLRRPCDLIRVNPNDGTETAPAEKERRELEIRQAEERKRQQMQQQQLRQQQSARGGGAAQGAQSAQAVHGSPAGGVPQGGAAVRGAAPSVAGAAAPTPHGVEPTAPDVQSGQSAAPVQNGAPQTPSAQPGAPSANAPLPSAPQPNQPSVPQSTPPNENGMQIATSTNATPPSPTAAAPQPPAPQQPPAATPQPPPPSEQSMGDIVGNKEYGKKEG